MPVPPSSTAPLAAHQLWRGIHQTLRTDVFAGVLLLTATAAAVVAANTSLAPGYEALRDHQIGIASLHLKLSLGQWAADGLLAIFFFVVGLELKEEMVDGRLRDPRAAALPVAAGAGGMIVPALVFTVINLRQGGDVLRGWAIPTATDIAFAVAVFAMLARFLPPAVRVFLITLAIVDDLLAISIIAVFYTDELHLPWLAAALVPLALFALAVQRGIRTWWLLLPLAASVWVCVHASGIHPTVAGVLLGFTVPVLARPSARVQVGTDIDGQPIHEGLAGHFADRWGPISTLVAIPVFAFLAAGVIVGGLSGLRDALGDTITLGIIAGLVLGKPLGILTATFLLTRVPGLGLRDGLRWPDLIGVALVAGIGFTVSLLLGELSYGIGAADHHVKIGVLLGSASAAVLGAGVLAARNRYWRQHTAHDPTADTTPTDQSTETPTAASRRAGEGGAERAER